MIAISVEKVIVMICGPCALPSPIDEATCTQTFGSILKTTGKGFFVWVRDNRIAVEPDVLLQMILGQTSSVINTQPQCSRSSGFSKPSNTGQAASNFPAYIQSVEKQQGGHITSSPSQKTVYDPLCYDQNVFQSQQAVPIQSAVLSSSSGGLLHKGEFFILKARLFNGKISYRHIEILHPGFKISEFIEGRLYQEYCSTPDAVVKIISDEKGKLRWSVYPRSKSKSSHQENLPSATEDEKSIHLANNETVVLITRVRYGQVSMEKDDVLLYYKDWKIPEYLINSLNRKYCSVADGKLYVFADDTGKL